jgi:hypothetical protein
MVATVVLSVGSGASAHADEQVGEPQSDTVKSIVAVGRSPVPLPITVAVGRSPVPLPITVAVGAPPVPLPITVAVGRSPVVPDQVSVGEPPVALARASASPSPTGPAGISETTGQMAGRIAGAIVEATATVHAARAMIDRML